MAPLKLENYFMLFILLLQLGIVLNLNETHFGTVVLSSNCNSINLQDLQDSYDELYKESKEIYGELSISTKIKCLDTKNVILLGELLCSFLETENIVGLVLSKECYPQCDLIAAIASELGIPTIQIEPYMLQSSFSLENQPFNLYPEEELLEAVIALINMNAINNVVILYDCFSGNDLSLNLYQTDVQLSSVQLPLKSDELYSSKLKDILIKIRNDSERNIVLHTTSPIILDVLEMALLVGMLNKEYLWIVTHLETIYLNMQMFTMSDVSLISLSFQNYDELVEEQIVSNRSLLSYQQMMFYDASMVVVDSFLILSNSLNLFDGRNFNCNDTSEVWLSGIELQNNIERSLVTGKTGNISFINRQRNNSYFNIKSLNHENQNFETVGNWSKNDGILTIFEEQQASTEVLRAVTILNSPYIELKPNHEELIGNNKFTGFLVETMEILSTKMGINYELYLVPDGYYGKQLANGSWIGVVGELVSDKADIAVASLTITSIRSQYIDFTNPFQTTGRNFVMRKPETYPTGFVFLDPLSQEVWLYIVASFVFVSILVIITSFISPYERISAKLEGFKYSRWDCCESFWFIFGSFVQQGTEFRPRSLSIRILSGSWWLFVLIIISMYTANMTAFLTVERLKGSIDTVDDLINNNEVSYGLMRSGSTEEYLSGSKIEPFITLWENIVANPSWFVDTLSEGMERTCNESYVFFTESATNIFYANTYSTCELSIIGNPIGEIGYGLAFQSGSELREMFSTEILNMQEDGSIEELMQNWNLVYEEETSASVAANGSVLEIENLVGVFYLLAGGCGLGIILSLVELIFYHLKVKIVAKSCSNKAKIISSHQKKEKENGKTAVKNKSLYTVESQLANSE